MSGGKSRKGSDKMNREPQTLYVTDRAAWRAWLEANHASEREVWLVYYKKHTRRPRIPYDDAVEEALCFGWIDSVVRRLDEDSYLQKFTPRKAKSNWCESNVKRARKLIAEGRMTKAGLDAIAEGALDTQFAPKPKSKDVDLQLGTLNLSSVEPVEAAVERDELAVRVVEGAALDCALNGVEPL
jgi:uncharacterized protein YdeI (YjbR/CyaY-like superfamily)